MAKGFQRYGLDWPTGTTDIEIEIVMIQKGGSFQNAKGETCGNGLFHHYKQAMSLFWPDDDHHEWSDLILKTILDERITTIQGPKDGSKTRTVSKWALVDYFCFPDDSLFLISSNYIQGLQLRVWGDLKTLYTKAKQVWPYAPGLPLESKFGIFTDELDDNLNIRDMRKGIICVAMRESNGQWVGLQKYTGIKQKRRRLIADECQFYSPAYLSTLANLDKGDFKGVFIGNPIGEMDPLDRLAEPIGGWGDEGEIVKTTTWKNKWEGVTVQLFGPDSPAIKHPGQYRYLTDQSDIDRIAKRFGKDSFEFYQQAHGIRKPGALARRVYTKEMSEQFGSQEPPMWGSGNTTKVFGLDAAYGGDRCVGIMAEFGPDINGDQIIAFSEPIIVPIRLYPRSVPVEDRVLPEDQIADFVRDYCKQNMIPPENVFFDSTGRGSLGTSFARRWSAAVNPIEFGGAPTDRPVCNDWFIRDPKTGVRRLKTAKEQYVKFITELWFSIRYAGEARQIRSLPNLVLEELSRRAWMPAKGDRKELETKEEYKKTYGYSPDYADAAATVVEGARRRGFIISSMESRGSNVFDDSWKFTLRDKVKRLKRSYTLNYN